MAVLAIFAHFFVGKVAKTCSAECLSPPKVIPHAETPLGPHFPGHLASLAGNVNYKGGTVNYKGKASTIRKMASTIRKISFFASNVSQNRKITCGISIIRNFNMPLCIFAPRWAPRTFPGAVHVYCWDLGHRRQL